MYPKENKKFMYLVVSKVIVWRGVGLYYLEKWAQYWQRTKQYQLLRGKGTQKRVLVHNFEDYFSQAAPTQ